MRSLIPHVKDNLLPNYSKEIVKTSKLEADPPCPRKHNDRTGAPGLDRSLSRKPNIYSLKFN